MRDAIGGVFTIQIILFFLIIINSYLAFSVNYTKAFRIKNNIVAIIEQQEGFTTQDDVLSGELSAAARIEQIMINTGYNVPDNYITDGNCGAGYTGITNNAGGFCLQVHKNPDGSGYYGVKTYVNINIPIINNILPLSNIFAIKGETKTIYSDKIVDLETD